MLARLNGVAFAWTVSALVVSRICAVRYAKLEARYRLELLSLGEDTFASAQECLDAGYAANKEIGNELAVILYVPANGTCQYTDKANIVGCTMDGTNTEEWYLMCDELYTAAQTTCLTASESEALINTFTTCASPGNSPATGGGGGGPGGWGGGRPTRPWGGGGPGGGGSIGGGGPGGGPGG